MNLKELFETVNKGRKFVTSKIKCLPMYTKFNDDMLESLLKNHPTKKITDIEYLILKPHEIFRSRTLYFKKPNFPEDNVSYKLCIQNLFGQYNSVSNNKASKVSSFRNAISNTKRAIFKSNIKSKCCEDCGKHTEKPHIDHYQISFKEILDQYLHQSDLTIETIETYYEKSQHHILDKTIKEDFIDYHDALVTYRLLCATCNIAHGSYGY